MGRWRGGEVRDISPSIGYVFVLIWLAGATFFVGFWCFVLYLAWKLISHVTGG